MRKIVFDIETSNIFSEVGSTNAADLDLALLVIHDSDTDMYSTYTQENLNELWPVIEKADVLIGFNSNHFDIPLLNKYYPGDLTQIKSLDILEEIRTQYGRRMKLDQIAQGTLGMGKSGNGLESIQWWRNGEKQKVADYCKVDVEITKKVYDYAREHNLLKFKEGGKIHDIKLDTSKWEENTGTPAITHTLPF